MFKNMPFNVLPRAMDMRFKKGAQEAFDIWVELFCNRDPEAVVSLYAEDALLNATLNPVPMLTQGERLQYFKLLAEKPGMRVDIQSQYMRMFNDWLAVISGLYRFSFQQGEEIINIPARYSMVFERREANGNKWMLIDHHSSCLPESIII